MTIEEKTQAAIERLKTFEPLALELDPEGGYYLCDSGGKDSSVIKEIARLAGVKFVIHHNHTTMDHPETVYFVRRECARWQDAGYGYQIEYPKESFWRLARRKKMLPTRIARFCCEALKEYGGRGKFCITGVRWAESVARKKNRGIVEAQARKRADSLILLNDNSDARKEIETCQIKGKRVINPIIDWSDADVWEFIERYNVPINPLYAKGFKRVGCMLCPYQSAKARKEVLTEFPMLRKRMINLVQEIIDDRERGGLPPMNETAEEYFERWLNG